MAAERDSALAGERLEGLADLARDLRDGHLHPQHYLDLLEHRFAKLEDRVHAFVPEDGRFLRLQKEAEALQERFPDPCSRPPLFGVPVGIKDIIHVGGSLTRAGSSVPPELLAGPEADAVQTLKTAGALIIGKTVTTEFAYLAPGPTRNPHDLNRTPGGSSSGSAAAVACGLSPLALGTQTVGSTIRPASFCGVVGFKPTYGRVILGGVIPLAPSADHMGLFCRDLGGIRLAASILCQGWREPGIARSPVLGIPEGPYLQRASHEGLAHFRKTLARLTQGGIEVRPLQVMANFEEVAHRHTRLVAGEAAAVHADWFSRHAERYRAETRGLVERGMGISRAELETYRESRMRLRDSLLEIMEREGISAWVAPSTVGPAPMGIHATGEAIMNLPWTHAGLPALSLPAGTNPDGMPMGLQVVGRWMEDEALLAVAGQMASVI